MCGNYKFSPAPKSTINCRPKATLVVVIVDVVVVVVVVKLSNELKVLLRAKEYQKLTL